MYTYKNIVPWIVQVMDIIKKCRRKHDREHTFFFFYLNNKLKISTIINIR